MNRMTFPKYYISLSPVISLTATKNASSCIEIIRVLIRIKCEKVTNVMCMDVRETINDAKTTPLFAHMKHMTLEHSSWCKRFHVLHVLQSINCAPIFVLYLRATVMNLVVEFQHDSLLLGSSEPCTAAIASVSFAACALTGIYTNAWT